MAKFNQFRLPTPFIGVVMLLSLLQGCSTQDQQTNLPPRPVKVFRVGTTSAGFVTPYAGEVRARFENNLILLAEAINMKGADFEVLNINLDTKSPTGQLMLTMLAAIAEFERDKMLERQREGIDIAKANGKYKGLNRLT